MTRKTKQVGRAKHPRLGALQPRYRFFLNPYSDVRFTSSCPKCSGKMGQRKLPLAIHVDSWGMVVLGKTCRFCPYCELLIAHQDEIEGNLSQLFSHMEPQVIGADYFVVGTVERKAWREGLGKIRQSDEAIDQLSDFKDYLHFEPAPRWEYDPKKCESTKPR